MEFPDILKMILASFGGAAIALLGLSKWLGTVWANRILEKERARYNRELEKYRAQLKPEADRQSRYIEAQFDLYNSLWESLYNLRSAGDALWKNVNEENMERFVKCHRQTAEMIQTRSLLIEEAHYHELTTLMEAFRIYQLTKGEIMHQAPIATSTGTMAEQAKRIAANRLLRDRYTALIQKIQISLQKQLKGGFGE